MDIKFADVADVIGIMVTAVVSLIGLYLANSYGRQTRAWLADVCRPAYAGLWEVMGLAAPTRLDMAGRAGALTREDRNRLYQLMTDWYYRDGNGMTLAELTPSPVSDHKGQFDV